MPSPRKTNIEKHVAWIGGVLFASVQCWLWGTRDFAQFVELLDVTANLAGVAAGFMLTVKTFLVTWNTPFIEMMRKDGILPQLLNYFMKAINASLLLTAFAFLILCAKPLLATWDVKWLQVLWAFLTGYALAAVGRALHIYNRVAKVSAEHKG